MNCLKIWSPPGVFFFVLSLGGCAYESKTPSKTVPSDSILVLKMALAHHDLEDEQNVASGKIVGDDFVDNRLSIPGGKTKTAYLDFQIPFKQSGYITLQGIADVEIQKPTLTCAPKDNPLSSVGGGVPVPFGTRTYFKYDGATRCTLMASIRAPSTTDSINNFGFNVLWEPEAP